MTDTATREDFYVWLEEAAAVGKLGTTVEVVPPQPPTLEDQFDEYQAWGFAGPINAAHKINR